MSTLTALVRKLWNYYNSELSGWDDGLCYGDYVAKLNSLLFVNLADEQSRPPFNRPASITNWKDLPALPAMVSGGGAWRKSWSRW